MSTITTSNKPATENNLISFFNDIKLNNDLINENILEFVLNSPPETESNNFPTIDFVTVLEN